MRIIVILLLLAIMVSLGSGLMHLTRGKGESGKLAKALTWRIGLSLVLFVALVVAGAMGWVEPGAL